MAQISLRIDDDVKVNAEKVCKDIGMSISTAVNIYLKRLVSERRIPFEVSADPFYSKENMDELERRVTNICTGKSVLKEHDLIGAEWCEKYDFKYVKEGNKMTDAMKELYDIFKEESKDKWIKEGKREGIKEGVINTLLMLVKDGIISVEDAAKRANLSVSTFQKYLNKKM